MSRRGAETELLLISEAVTRLGVGMFGGDLKRPDAVEVAKKTYPHWSIRWGPQKEDAAKRIYEAIVQGKLSVLVLPASTDDDMHRTHLQVPLGVIKQMILERFPFRLPIS